MGASSVWLCLIAALMATRLFDLYFSDLYVCPRCGARDPEDHDEECSWRL